MLPIKFCFIKDVLMINSILKLHLGLIAILILYVCHIAMSFKYAGLETTFSTLSNRPSPAELRCWKWDMEWIYFYKHNSFWCRFFFVLLLRWGLHLFCHYNRQLWVTVDHVPHGKREQNSFHGIGKLPSYTIITYLLVTILSSTPNISMSECKTALSPVM